jgi:hypothetical protein
MIYRSAFVLIGISGKAHGVYIGYILSFCVSNQKEFEIPVIYKSNQYSLQFQLIVVLNISGFQSGFLVRLIRSTGITTK